MSFLLLLFFSTNLLSTLITINFVKKSSIGTDIWMIYLDGGAEAEALSGTDEGYPGSEALLWASVSQSLLVSDSMRMFGLQCKFKG